MPRDRSDDDDNALNDVHRALNDRDVNAEDFKKVFADVLDVALLRATKLRSESAKGPNLSYRACDHFWRDALAKRHCEGMSIELLGFHLMEWLPLSPGRFFTADAAQHRRTAKLYDHGDEYLPLGKERMILGGVGCVRLSAKTIDDAVVYFMGASQGRAHLGIPVALRRKHHEAVVNELSRFGGCRVNLKGTLRVLPPSASLLAFETGLPRYCIVVDDLADVQSPQVPLLSDIAIMFPSDRSPTPAAESLRQETDEARYVKSWAFATFTPGKDNDDRNGLGGAVKWLRDYATRYSGRLEAHTPLPILSDFDEHCSHFDGPIEFPLSSLLQGGVDKTRLAGYGHHYHITLNRSDVFQNISNSTIATRGAAINQTRDGSFREQSPE